MPQIYLARFRQRPFGVASAHWALFLPKSFDPNGCPLQGALFHARKEWNNSQGSQPCTIQGKANYGLEPDFLLLSSPSLLDSHCLKDTEVTPAQMSQACTYISQDRSFNLITRNCQEWVKDVIDYLVAHGVITDAVYGEMDARGYKTLKEESVDKSLSMCARSRRGRS